jgi:hypothetical protein
MIRSATIWDAHKIVPLWVKMHESLGLPFVRLDEREKERFYLNIIAQIERDDCFVAVSEVDGEINGFVHARIEFKDYGISEPISKWEGIYIEPRGGGMEFVKHLEDWTEFKGVKHIMFETVFDKYLSERWDKRGYRPVQIVYHREV